MGERYGRLIDQEHFLGRSAFAFPWKEENLPPANLKKSETHFEFEIAVPGYSKEEIEILIEGDLLKIKGHKNVEGSMPEKVTYILEEFDYESFERCFRLSSEIANDDISATCAHGVLRVVFSRAAKHGGTKHLKVPVT
jgi:HSP20 family protein